MFEKSIAMQVTFFRNRSALVVLWMGLFSTLILLDVFIHFGNAQEASTAKALAGTSVLDIQGDIASELVDGVDRFLLKELDKSVQRRLAFWPKPSESDAKVVDDSAYEAAMKPLREELRMRIGMIDDRVKCETFTVQSVVEPGASDSNWVAAN